MIGLTDIEKRFGDNLVLKGVTVSIDEGPRPDTSLEGLAKLLKGAWGASGSTTVTLARARVRATTTALEAAWRRRAPKAALAAFDDAASTRRP